MTESTNNYEIFKFREDNREKIVSNHVKRLSESIQARNLLYMRPIVVNEQMEVLDGQHRLLAAKMLGVEIFYKVEKSCNVEDIILLNTSKSWGLADFLNYYVKNGHEEYIKLKDFAFKNRLQTRIAYELCCARSDESYTLFKSGKFKFRHDLYIDEIDSCWRTIDFIKKMNGQSHYTTSAKFWKSLVKLVSMPDFNVEKWMSNLSRMVERCCAKVSSDEYRRLFMDIYNWKNPHKIDLMDR